MKIMIDCGHGKSTPGKRIPNLEWVPDGWRSVREWELNNRVGKALEKILAPYDVTIVRADDRTGAVDVPLSQRVKKSVKCDLSISIHFNAGLDGRKGGGMVVYYPDPAARGYAEHCYNAILMRAHNRGNRATPLVESEKRDPKTGKRQHSLYMLRNNKARVSLLVECAFMDGPDDLVSHIRDEMFYWNVAQGMAEFILGAFPGIGVKNGTKAV